MEWINIEDDFADSNRYAGDKNIAHIVEVAKMFDLSQNDDKQILDKGIFVGVDGCKGGWITALISNRELFLKKDANLSAIGKGLSEQTIAIIPKMREVDDFLLSNEEYMNVIRESHSEVCFARLNGEVLMTNKSEKEGITDRVQVLSRYLQGLSEEYVRTSAKKLGCKLDDILDAVCLAVTANLNAQGRTEIIPENPSTDDKGLKMQMVIPKG